MLVALIPNKKKSKSVITVTGLSIFSIFFVSRDFLLVYIISIHIWITDLVGSILRYMSQLKLPWQKYHKLGGLNIGTSSPRSRCQQLWFPGKGPLPSFQMAAFSLCPHKVERKRALVFLIIIIRALILSWGPYPHDLIWT